VAGEEVRRAGREEAKRPMVMCPRRLAFSTPLARREKELDVLLCLYLSRAFFASDDDIIAGGETPLLGGAVPGRRGDGDNERRRRRRRRLGLVGWGRGAVRASAGGGRRRPHMSALSGVRGWRAQAAPHVGAVAFLTVKICVTD
jgi:hypothetical protein